MYLKKIVLNGFKSFYSRTELEFPPRLTGIVGPNGCGKSNILDAVRWVLGEQSAKQLRGEQISDIISAGNARRPGKKRARAFLTFADCQDVLDTESDELEVGREVNLDGQGSYYINGEQVRLKDIKDLFRDTGVGKNLYSIIGQGEVNKLIQSKPEERREIIEEAAGIATYRHRRDLTRRRLNQTVEEMAVVEKELREKRGRLGQLKSQAGKAREVRKLRGRLRKAKLEQARREFHRLQTESDELKQQKKVAIKENRDAKQEKSGIEANKSSSMERLRNIDSLLADITRLKDPVLDKHRENRETRGRLEVRIEALIEQMGRETTVIKENTRRRRQQLQSLAKNYANRYVTGVRIKIAETEINMIGEREEYWRDRRRSLSERLDDIRDRSLFQVSEESEFKHWQQQLKRENRDLEEEYERLHNLLHEKLKNANEVKKILQQKYGQYVDTVSNSRELELEVDRIDSRLEVLNKIHENLRGSEEKLRQKLEGKRSRHQTLDRLFSQYEGFYRGVKTLMQAHKKGSFPTVKGVVANLINVPERLESALQVALGGRVQNIVIEERSCAGEMIEYLKKQKGGRVTFLPLDTLKPSPPAYEDKLLQDSGVLGFGAELIDYPAEVSGAIKYLLGRVLVVETLADAHRVYDSNMLHSGLIVTLEGEKIHPGGAITGGSLKRSRGELLTRSDQIDRLSQEIKNLENELEAQSGGRTWLLQEIKKTKGHKELVTNALQGIREEVREGYRSVKELTHRLGSEKENYRNFLVQMADLIEKRLKNTNARQAAVAIATSIADREAQRRQENQSFRDSLSWIEQHLEELQKNWRKGERYLQETRSRQREVDSTIKQIEQRRNRLKKEALTARQQWNLLRGNSFEKQAEKVSVGLACGRLKTELETWRDLEAGASRSRHSHERELEQINDKLRLQEARVAKKEGELQKIENELANKKARYTEHRTMLVEELEVEPSAEALDKLETGEMSDVPGKELNKKTRKFKNKLRGLQPVNMLAQKEADKLEEEVSEIAEQKDDLEESCQKLSGMIRRLNSRARQQFQEAFSEIQDYFQDFVADLFNGGVGRLSLTEGPVLEAGINVEIEPPGENLKTMSSLSGGEKTLAAIAFLFALFERKASPFCFLDEVDAPFDDENIAQLIGLLNRYSSETQFVIITHNKTTMQAAQQLFGVTMEESGVTSVVRIDLDNADSFREKQEVG